MRSTVLTLNGKSAVVLLDAVSYEEMVDQLDEARTIAALQEGIGAADRGEMKPAEQVLSEMKARYGLPG